MIGCAKCKTTAVMRLTGRDPCCYYCGGALSEIEDPHTEIVSLGEDLGGETIGDTIDVEDYSHIDD